jgi:hypothetical protein
MDMTHDKPDSMSPVRRPVKSSRIVWVVPFALSIIALAIGLWFYPMRSAVVVEQFNLEAGPTGTVGAVNLLMSQVATDNYSLRITLTNASAAVDLRFHFQLDVSSRCPSSRFVLTCHAATASNGDVMDVDMSQGADVNVAITAPVFTFGSNGETAEGWLPYVSCSNTCVGPSSSPTIFRVVYQIPNVTRYNWISGVPPGFSNGRAFWQQVASQLQEPVLVSGFDPRAQQDDQNDTLIAGIFLGLAAALFADGIRQVIESRGKNHASEV